MEYSTDDTLSRFDVKEDDHITIAASAITSVVSYSGRTTMKQKSFNSVAGKGKSSIYLHRRVTVRQFSVRSPKNSPHLNRLHSLCGSDHVTRGAPDAIPPPLSPSGRRLLRHRKPGRHRTHAFRPPCQQEFQKFPDVSDPGTSNFVPGGFTAVRAGEACAAVEPIVEPPRAATDGCRWYLRWVKKRVGCAGGKGGGGGED